MGSNPIMRLVKKQVEEFLKTLPYVKRVKPDFICDGYRWSQMPLKAVYDPVLKEKYRCRNDGHWKFKALKRSYARDGTYCFAHLHSLGLVHDMDEEKRTKKYALKFSEVLRKRATIA